MKGELLEEKKHVAFFFFLNTNVRGFFHGAKQHGEGPLGALHWAVGLFSGLPNGCSGLSECRCVQVSKRCYALSCRSALRA